MNEAEANLLVQCARAHLHPQELPAVAQMARDEKLDWGWLLYNASEHGVMPLLYYSLSRSEAIDSIPPVVKEKLQQVSQGNTHRNLLLMKELLKLSAAMNSQGVRMLAYKGPLLAVFGYGDLSLRQPGDLDILVPQQDVGTARGVIESLGYQLTLDMNAKQEAAYVASPHEYDFAYIHPETKVMIELHWRIAGKMFSFDPDPLELWRSAKPQSLFGGAMRVLCSEDLLLILCAHGAKHFWTRLGWICDVAELIRANPFIDWKIVMDRAALLRSRDMTLLGLLLANRIFDANVPAEILQQARHSLLQQADELQERLFHEPVEPDELPKGMRAQLSGGGLWESLMFQFRTREDWMSGLRYVFHRAFTPNAVDRGAMNLPRGLGFLQYLLRPIRLFNKYGLRRKQV